MATRRSTRPKRRDAEVLQAAARVFHAQGYTDASVQDVADELGILKGSLYHYIDSKEDLLFRMLEQTHADVGRILAEVAAVEGLDPLQRLRLYVQRQVEYNAANQPRVSVYYHDLHLISGTRRRDMVFQRRSHEEFVVELVREAQAAGLADPALDPELTSRCLFATIIWTYNWFRAARHEAATVAETCAAFAVNGLLGGAPDEPAVISVAA